MPYLEAATRHRFQGQPLPEALDAHGKRVVIIGGGDTGADCIATALRQHARSVLNVTRREPPPATRPDHAPWPGPPQTYTLDYAHAEGQHRDGHDPRRFGVQPLAYLAGPDGRVAGLHVETTDDAGQRTRHTLPADLVILSVGFTGPDTPELFAALDVSRDPRILIAGDARRGPSLVVHAIAEGRAAAAAIDRRLAAS